MMATAGLAATLAACGSSVSNSASDALDTTIDSAAPAASNSSNPIAAGLNIDFTASLLDGSPITLGEQLTQRPVALWFWAPG